MKKMISKALPLFFVVIAATLVFVVRARSGDDTFQQAVAEYQQSPTKETADKVIKLAVAMDKLPTVPEEARKHFIKGAALFKEAKSPADFTQVLDEFKQALHVAPWWPEARYNFALACESAGNYPSAVLNLQLYMLFKLPDAEARSVQDKIYVLEAKMEKAANAESAEKNKISTEQQQKTAQAEEEARAQQQKAEDIYRKCDGKRYVLHYEEIGNVRVDCTADLRGNKIVLGEIYTSGDRDAIPSNTRVGVWKELWDLTIVKKEMDGGRLVLYFDGSDNNWMYEKAYINEDSEIKFKCKSGGESGYYLPKK